MWEPHQLVQPARRRHCWRRLSAVTGGTTGVLLFFRLVVLVCKAAHELRRFTGSSAGIWAGAGRCWRRWCCSPLCPSGFWGRITPASSSIGLLAAFLCLHHYVSRGFQTTVARAAGSGLRLLRLSGVPPEHCGVCGAVGGAVCAGAARRRALPLGHSPRRLAADRQLCRVRRGVFALCAVGRWSLASRLLLAARLHADFTRPAV